MDIEAILANINEAFLEAGFGARIHRPETDEFFGVSAFIFSGQDRGRQVVAVCDEDAKSVRLYLLPVSFASPESLGSIPPLEDVHEIHHVAADTHIGEILVKWIRETTFIGKPSDPQASSDDLREVLSFVADPKRNKGSFGNPRGGDLIVLANTMLRILERIERIESRLP